MRRGMLVILGSVLAALALAAGWVALGAAEPSGMAPGGVLARLTVPAPIRDAAMPGACGEVALSRRWIECGGICGAIYRLEAASTAPVGRIEAAMAALRERALPRYDVRVRAEPGEGCRPASVEFIIEE